ncbi:hypothetical protein C0J52_25113 [Blattella germanica]|nr:hypothetical protein C0J52_25113 [Blattella germanica]
MLYVTPVEISSGQRQRDMSEDTGDGAADVNTVFNDSIKVQVNDLRYKELQNIAKSWNLPANLKVNNHCMRPLTAPPQSYIKESMEKEVRKSSCVSRGIEAMKLVPEATSISREEPAAYDLSMRKSSFHERQALTSFNIQQYGHPSYNTQYNGRHSEPPFIPQCPPSITPPALNLQNHGHHSELPPTYEYRPSPTPPLHIPHSEHNSEPLPVCQYQQFPMPLFSIKHNVPCSDLPPACQYEQFSTPPRSKIQHSGSYSGSSSACQYQPTPSSFDTDIQNKGDHLELPSACQYQPVPTPSLNMQHIGRCSESAIVGQYEQVQVPLSYTVQSLDNNRESKEQYVPNRTDLQQSLQPIVGQEQLNNKKLPSSLEITLNIKSEYLLAPNYRPMPKTWTMAATSIHQCYVRPVCSTKLSIQNELLSTRPTLDYNNLNQYVQTETEQIEIQPLAAPVEPPVCASEYLNHEPLQAGFPDFRQNNELSFPLIYNYVASTENQLKEQQEMDTQSAINFDFSNLEEDDNDDGDRPKAISTPNNEKYPEGIDILPPISQIPQLTESMMENQQQELQQQLIQKRKTRHNCHYHRQGCTRSNMDIHETQKHELECEFQTVTCYNQCNWKGLLKHLAIHLREFVPPTKVEKLLLVKASLEVIGTDGIPYSWRGKVKPVFEPLSTLWATNQCLSVDPAVLGAIAGSNITFHTKITIYGNAK